MGSVSSAVCCDRVELWSWPWMTEREETISNIFSERVIIDKLSPIPAFCLHANTHKHMRNICSLTITLPQITSDPDVPNTLLNSIHHFFNLLTSLLTSAALTAILMFASLCPHCYIVQYLLLADTRHARRADRHRIMI